MDLGAEQRVVTSKEASNVHSTLDWLNYEFWTRLDAGIGLSFGYVNMETRPDMFFEGIQARTRWRITDRWSLHVQGGAETRQFLAGDSQNLVNPLAALSLQFQPVEVTRLALEASRTVSASYLQNQDVTETVEVGARLNQRFFQAFYFDLAGGYSNVKYVSVTPGSPKRVDDFFSVDVSLSCRPLKRGFASVFYRYSDNVSNLSVFSLTSNQAGFEIGYRF